MQGKTGGKFTRTNPAERVVRAMSGAVSGGLSSIPMFPTFLRTDPFHRTIPPSQCNKLPYVKGIQDPLFARGRRRLLFRDNSSCGASTHMG
jgi:hypothetical protein